MPKGEVKGFMNVGRRRVGALQVGVILLTLATAGIHLYYSTVASQGGPIFFLNGLGYMALLATLYLPLPGLARFSRAVRRALLGYTALTVLLWLLMGDRVVIAYTDKIIETLLIVMLWVEVRTSARKGAP